ncbi:MAG TPA: BamA/TamA family outer membrane protein [Polyangiales bacterium]|nr:BamA/TamA family outer membrane protein [Polyangiales bacterium]
MALVILLICADVRADDDAARTELGLLPLLGGDSDLGLGGGALGSITRIEPGWEPYRYRVEVGAVVTFKTDGELQVPYQDVYVLWTIPDLIPKRLRLELRPSYTRERNQNYYGIGNATRAPELGPLDQPAVDYFQYGRMHPTLQLRLLLHLGHGFFLGLGNSLTYNELYVHPGSKLDADRHDPQLAGFFGPTGPHWVDFFEYTLLYDTRDNETSAQSGMHHQLRLRLSPGGTEAFPYRYGQVDVIARFFTTHGRSVFAARVVGDAQFGDPPFYELARFEDTFALGGVNGVRGVPGQRYYGKLKLFGNLEWRARLVDFRLFGLPCSLGSALFFDAGRLWAPDPELDGPALGLKFGVGAGLRLQQGQAFVARADLAWSPDARPIGAYVTAGQLF